MQEEIINSVLQGNDTLALMATAGGKSICYQIPAMVKDGICLVITPLIALMKDQVDKLTKKDIKAIGIYSGMTKSEIDIAFDKCIYGDVKLLYISPERLLSDLARTRIRKMKLNLIAVDEAHCISQWGYDFRPPYLKIADIRQYFPAVPVLALTATATPFVVEDIQKKLLFRKENVLRVSFERKNLAYTVSYAGDKSQALLKFLKKEKGQGIIYVKSRLKTSEIAELLNRNEISATFYHAGLESKIRDARQKDWMKGKTSVIVCTTAFGMGIDKPDVRFVIHLDPPENIEEYYQQAGRAGRDGQNSTALLLFSENDNFELYKSLNTKFPGIDKIKTIYHALGNYYQLATGSGQDNSFDFDIKLFCSNYDFEVLEVFSSLRFLEREGYIILTERFHKPAKLHFKMDKGNLYNFQVANMQFDAFIKIILRSYAGVFNDFVDCYENDIAYRANIPVENVIKLLGRLKSMEVLDYIPQKNKPQIIYSLPRADVSNIYISPENYSERKKIAEEKLKQFIEYASNGHKCRSQLLLAYFGEDDSKRCGICDLCIKRNTLDLSEIEFDSIVERIKPALLNRPLRMNEIIKLFENIDEERILKVIRWLRENGKIHMNSDNNFEWIK